MMDMASQSQNLTSGKRSIAIVIGVTSCISVASILFLSVRVAVAAFRPIFQGLKGRRDTKEAVFFRTQLGAYIMCLLFANLLNGISGFFEFSWAKQGRIGAGPECTAQGSLIQVGDFAAAYFTAVIAIHTFQSLVLHKRYPTWVVGIAVAFGWGAAIALGTAVTTVTTFKHGPFFNASSGIWCAISSGYTVEQFVVYYLPIILSAFVTAALYAIIYLCLRGTLVIGDGIKLNLSPENVHGWAARLNGREEYRHFLAVIIRSFLWFPLAFIVLFLPITIAGLMRISGMDTPLGLLAFAGVAASLNGLANVLILLNAMRILRPENQSESATSGSESFFVPEERKQTPIETSKPRPFDEKAITAPSPRSLQHGRSFPPPVSRVGSPLSRISSAYGLPASPRSGRVALPSRASEEQWSEHAPTPQMKEMWLRHQKSTSSVDSTTALLRATPSTRMTHSRNTSASMSSENIHTIIGKPILPSGEITKRVDADIMSIPSRSRATSPGPGPAITITLPSSPRSPGLPPPPRPPRGDSIRESLLNVNMKLSQEVPALPPAPPEPSSISNRSSPAHRTVELPSDSGRKQQEQGAVNYRPPTPMTTHSASCAHSTRTSMSYENEDFEIHRVDSRDRLRPAISAVARVSPSTGSNNASQLAEAKNDMAMASVVSLPESVGGLSLTTGESEDTMHAEIRSRADSLENAEGALSSIAWASLVAHTAVQERLAGEATLQSPTESDMWDDDYEDDTELSPPQRRLSELPTVLRPGTPESVGAGRRYGFNALRPTSPTQTIRASLAERDGDSNSSGALRPGPGAPPRMRSFNGVGTSAYVRKDGSQLGRSDTRRNQRDGPPGYI